MAEVRSTASIHDTPLGRWGIPGLELDVTYFSKAAFQELLLMTIFVLPATLIDYILASKHNHIDGCPCFIYVLLLIFAGLSVVRMYEREMLKCMCSCLGINYIGSSSQYKVVQKFTILVLIMGVNYVTFALHGTGSASVSSDQIPNNPGLKKKWLSHFDAMALAYLKVWFAVTVKLIGTYGVVGFCGLYVDLFIYSYHLLVPVPSPDDVASEELTPFQKDNNNFGVDEEDLCDDVNTFQNHENNSNNTHTPPILGF